VWVCAQAASKAQAAAAVSAGLVIFPISGSPLSGARRPEERSEPFFTTEVAGPSRSVQQNGEIRRASGHSRGQASFHHFLTALAKNSRARRRRRRAS
jgi:hypothetical protein